MTISIWEIVEEKERKFHLLFLYRHCIKKVKGRFLIKNNKNKQTNKQKQI